MAKHGPKGYVTERKYFEELRELDRRYDEERDRRYSEVNIEREKALKIKETADLAALDLAREIQTYKEIKANELREQLAEERFDYATKADLLALDARFDAAIEPLKLYVSNQHARSIGIEKLYGWFLGGAALVLAAVVYFTNR